MESTDLYTKTIRAIDEDVKALEEYILDGSPADEVAYQKAAAERRGLLRARGILEEKFRRANSEE